MSFKGKILLLILCSIFIPTVFAVNVNIEHYSVQDGLSVGTVVTMHQDRKGIMWFGTFAGLNKFDGYKFQTFSNTSNGNNSIAHSRVDEIMEDSFGFLWLLTNSGKVQRFDPRTENFLSVLDTQESQTRPLLITSIRVFASGEVWLIAENTGVYHIATNPQDYSLSITPYTIDSGIVDAKCVYDVYKDWQKNIWILSDNGLIKVPNYEGEPYRFLVENSNDPTKEKQVFRSVMELEDQIWFGSGKGRIWIYNKSAQSFALEELSIKSEIIEIKRLDDRNFFILTADNGFILYNPKSTQEERYYKATHLQMSSDKMISSYIDRRGDVWIQTMANGVLHFNPKSKILDNFIVKTDNTSPFVVEPNFIIFEDNRDVVWVHPRGGGFSYFDREHNKLMPFYNEPGNADRKFSNLIHSAMCDAQGNLWLCTYSKGIDKVVFLRPNFQQIRPNDTPFAGFSDNEMRAVYEDSHGYLWLATKDASLYIYNKNFEKIGYLGVDGKINSGNKLNLMVYDIMEDDKGRIWLGTKGLGVNLLERSAQSPLSFKITNYRFDSMDLFSLSDDAVYTLLQDSKKHIWIGTFGGGINLVDESDSQIRFINHRNNLRSYPVSQCMKIRHMAEDSANNIWIATNNGVVVFNNEFDRSNRLVFNFISSDESNGLNAMDIHYICKTKNNDLYFATFGGGLSKLMRYEGGVAEFKNYSKLNGAPSDIILNLAEDSYGKLWMSSANGLLSFDPQTEQFNSYDQSDGLNCTVFSEASILNMNDERIAIGSNAGLHVFSPEKLRKSSFVPPLVFTDFQLFNKDVEVGGIDSPLKYAIDYTDTITLTSNQTVFTIAFSALDFENIRGINYAYRLKGFEDEWSYTRMPLVTYTNLPKGNYLFEVKSTNSDGVWVDNTRHVQMRVLPSFWQSTAGYLLYALGILSFLGLAFFIQYQFFRLRNKVELEHNVANIKLRFFTDISHELRTPLTLIASPIEYLVKNENTDPVTREQLIVVQRNVDRMLRLVNQILDFRKIQSNKMKLKIERINFGEFASHVGDNFKRMASEKSIKFTFIDNSAGVNIWADKDKVEKILFNLLVNAFKFTPSGKSIEMEVFNTENSLSVRIQDEGVGMPREKLDRLFERYDSSLNYEGFQPSTGIGLSLTKELIDMHHATIIVDSQLNKGTWFTVSFLLGTKHYEGDVDYIVEDGENPDLVPIVEEHEAIVASRIEAPVDKPSILIVEDNSELRLFLKTVLEKEFRIIEASNGREGLNHAFESIPDIIISDVMMPEMNGVQMTTALKDDLRTSHTPVILLTAKTAMEDRLEALNSGADDYITKPFSAEYLEARIRNLLAQRSKLQDLYRNKLNFTEEPQPEWMQVTPSVPNVVSQDDLFIANLIKSLEENMENSELTVDDLVSLAGLSRSVFFKKLKSLTGLAPIEFIREMRIKRAAQLIETKQYNISQVAYMVGMNDPRYFSRCFKQKYGITPTEYKEKSV